MTFSQFELNQRVKLTFYKDCFGLVIYLDTTKVSIDWDDHTVVDYTSYKDFSFITPLTPLEQVL